MANRGPLLQSDHGKSGVDYHAKLYEAPLLPFEKQLIETIGATEEEYRYLVTEAIRRGKVRPAGYEHVPDIENKVIAAWVVQLAIGLTLTAVSYLLTPKPKQLKTKVR